MSEWKEETFGEIATGFLSGGTPDSSRADFWDGDIPWITSKWLGKKLDLTDGEKFISEEAVTRSASKIVPKDSIIFATRVGVGKVGINRIELAINQDLAGVLIDTEKYDINFLAYQLGIDSIQQYVAMNKRGATIKGITRDCLEQIRMKLPPLEEQKAISYILSTTQRAINAQERIIQTTTELKKALMQKLFSEGLRGEPQKETEIGLVPESWEVVDLGAFCRVQSGFAFRSQDYVKGEGGIPITKIGDIQDGFVSYTEKSSYVPEEFWGDRRLDQFKLQAGDVLIALTGATTGKSGVFQHSYRAFLNQRAGRFVPDDEGLMRSFLPFLVRQPYFQIEISSNILVAAQGNISPKRIEKIKVGLPEPTVQEEIASSLEALDRKVACSQAKRAAFQDLLCTLLHELMTAKTRVHELEISA
jgi:type I restriction enzyme S subunit